MAAKKATVVSVIGARPQFVKLAALAGVLNRKFNHLVVHSGQHYDHNLSDIFFEQLSISRPAFNLNAGSGDHGRQTGRILERCEKIFQNLRPTGFKINGRVPSLIIAEAVKKFLGSGHGQ